MSRALLVIRGQADRQRAVKLLQKVPFGTRIEFKAAKRTLPQNDRMWAMLTDISKQMVWHGLKMRPDDWKLVFIDALNRDLRMVPNLEGTGFVILGLSSRDLSRGEMSDLMELIAEFGARHGVRFGRDDQEAAA
jgi:NinB protein